MKRTLLVTLLSATALFAQSVFYVSPTGGGSGASIDDPTTFGVAEASITNGTTIYFLPGTYVFSQANTKFLTPGVVDDVTLIGLAGPDSTIIDGDNVSDEWGYVFDGWLVEGLTFQHFAYSDQWNGQNAILRAYGDANDSAHAARISNCIFRDNGAMGVWGGNANDMYLVIENCLIENNSPESFLTGVFRSVAMINNTFHGNTANTSGNDRALVCFWNYGTTDMRSDFRFFNNIVSENATSTDDYLAIMGVKNDEPNTGADTSKAKLYVGNNLFYENYYNATHPADSVSVLDGGEGTAELYDEGGSIVGSDPLFTDAANGDFTLQAGSPAVGAGKGFPQFGIAEGTDIGRIADDGLQLRLTFEEGAAPLVDYSPRHVAPVAHNDGITYVADDPASGAYAAGFPAAPSDPNAPVYITVENPGFDATGDVAFSGWFKFEGEFRPDARLALLAGDSEDPLTILDEAVLSIGVASEKGALFAEYVGVNGVVRLETRDNVAKPGEWRRIVYKKSNDFVTFEVRNENDEVITKLYDDASAPGNPMIDGSSNTLYLGWALNESGDPRFFAGDMDNIELRNRAFVDSADLAVPPVITSAASVVAGAGETVRYEANHTHQNGLATTFSFVDLPAWLTLDNDSTVSGIAAVSGSTTETGVFTVVADDGELTDTLHVSWKVYPGTLFVSPTGAPDGLGDETDPLDLVTAFAYAGPGASLLLLPGTYEITAPISTEEAKHADLEIRSTEGALETALDGGDSVKKFISVRSGTTIDGINFQHFGPGDEPLTDNILIFESDFDSTKPATVTGCVFQSNTTRAMYGLNGCKAKVLVHNNVFKNNEDRIIASVFREVKFYNNTVFGNNANDDELIEVRSIFTLEARLDMKNNIFSDNVATNTLASAVSEQGGTHTIAVGTKNMFSDNAIGGGVVDFDPKNGTQDVDTTAPFAIMADPMFEDEATGTLTLLPGSPAVGAGVEIAEIGTGPNPNLGCLTIYLLPVELAAFSAEPTDEGVALRWTTASEVNALGFSLERNYENGGFAEVAYLDANGAQGGDYAFVDRGVERAGVYTYRLKQVDRDGAFRYAGAVEVEYAGPLLFALEQNFPNPFNPSTTIRYELAQDVHVTLVVYNSIGEQVATLVDARQAAGRYDASFNASNFASGIYFYRLEAGDFVDVKRMALLK